MNIPMLILILVVAFALILIVMVQNPKGGGLSSTFGGNANTIGGVQNTNSFLDKATWTLAISLFALILLSNFTIDRSNVNGGGDNQVIELNDELQNTTTVPPVSENPETKTTQEDTKK